MSCCAACLSVGRTFSGVHTRTRCALTCAAVGPRPPVMLSFARKHSTSANASSISSIASRVQATRTVVPDGDEPQAHRSMLRPAVTAATHSGADLVAGAPAAAGKAHVQVSCISAFKLMRCMKQ